MATPTDPSGRRIIVATAAGGARGELATAAAVAVAAAGLDDPDRPGPALVAELGATGSRSPTMLASLAARDLERELRSGGFAAAARGALCWLALPDGAAGFDELERALDLVPASAFVVAVVPPGLWAEALSRPGHAVAGALIRCDLPAARSLAALAAMELRERGLVTRIDPRGLRPLAARRALAGIDPGGAASRRAQRIAAGLAARARPAASVLNRGRRRAVSEVGQSLPLVLAAAFVILVGASILAAFGGAVTGAEGAQRGADLAALSAVRSMRDDLPKLVAPSLLPNGRPNPAHLDRGAYLERAVAAARQAAARNGLDPGLVKVTFPDSTSPIPLRSRVAVRAALSRARGVRVAAHAEAEATVPASYTPTPAYASGGGYSGPLVYRQGKGMRPDVAAAFDRMAAAAANAGIQLVINSAYRSDAEQARLYAQNPDPRMVAPPGTSLHRCATELDLGPPSAYAWLDANAPRFGFLMRYPWEPWHWGYTRGPAPCSDAGNSIGAARSPDGQTAGRGVPGFVPDPYRAPIMRSAARWHVPAALLAAQLEAESGFDPTAVSPAGAEGIAQFMPGTAASYGLRDPFDAVAAIDAEAHLMSDLLREFGSIPLALAAYNAGPGPVAACGCVPAIPETRAYVARILALMGAAGEIAAPALEVRLVD